MDRDDHIAGLGNMIVAPRIARELAFDYCAAAAVHLLRQREAQYPAMIEAAKLTAPAAALGLEIMRVVLAQWRWVIDPARAPAPPHDDRTGHFGLYNYILAAELDRVAARARTLAAANPDSFDKTEMADLCEALAWYQADQTSTARIVRIIALDRPASPPASSALCARRAA